jgi:hypothetical protein
MMEFHEEYRLYDFYIIRNNIEGAEFLYKWTGEKFVGFLET